MKKKRKKIAACLLAAGAVALLAALIGRHGKTEPVQQRAAQQVRGSVTIHTTDGETWQYYGKITITRDGSDGHDAVIDMDGAWMVGTTDKRLLPDHGWETGDDG